MIIVLHLIDVFLLLAEVVSDPDLEYKGEQLTINESTVLQFYCSTMNAFLGCTVEFLRNRKTYDDIRFINNTCHHKDGICQPYRCHCSKDCTTISWNFTAMSNHVNSTFGCGARIQDNGNIYKANSSLQWTGSDFIVLQKSFILLNVGIATTGFPITTVESNQSSAAVVIAVLTSSNVFILTTCILIVCCLQKRQQESAQKEQDKDKKQVGRNEYELHELQVKDSEDYTTCEVKSKQVCTVHEVRKSYENCNIVETSNQYVSEDNIRNPYENWNPIKASNQPLTEPVIQSKDSEYYIIRRDESKQIHPGNRVSDLSEQSRTSSNISVISSNLLIGKTNT